MSALSFSAAATFVSLCLAASPLPAQTVSTGPSSGLSKVRIVRLSEVRGTVQMDRAVGRGYEPAVQNLPIVEASRIRTGVGIAEIEFEDNSTLRLAPNTEVAFQQLERAASGATITHVRVVRGMAYVSLMKTRGNDFTLSFGPARNPEDLRLLPASHVRLQVDPAGAHLAVLSGNAEVNSANGPITVQRGRTVTIDFAKAENPRVIKQVASESFDKWDRESAQYHERVASLSAFGSSDSPYAYGQNDMMYYGAFEDAGGCGTMWRPYFASAAWNPYGNGAWAWYGNAGYSWVSPYPWGWTPYHYGSWSYCQGSGWGWIPGGSWNGLGNAPTVTRSIGSGGGLGLPRPPGHPPTAGRPTLVPIRQGPLVISGMDDKGSFIFRSDSAGLGIPRNELGNLRGFSRDSLRRGTASTPVYVTMQTDVRGGNRAMGGEFAPTTMHRGYAPPPQMQSQIDSFGNFSPGLTSGSGGTSTPVSTASRPIAGGGTPRGSGGTPH